MESSQRNKAVILVLTYGEPQDPGFKVQYRYSLAILRELTRKLVPLPGVALPFLAAYRAWRRSRAWKKRAYASPLENITRQQASALSSKLPVLMPAWRHEVKVVFEFRQPELMQVLPVVSADPESSIIVLPLYLADSDFTTGISMERLKRYEQDHGLLTSRPIFVSHLARHERLAELMARFVEKRLEAAGWSRLRSKEAGLILGAHGTMVEGPQGLNTGFNDTYDFYRMLESRLSNLFAQTSIGWLNHYLGRNWTSPDLATAARAMAESGIGQAVYFPFGFFADNAETQLESRAELAKVPQLSVLHLPCVNAWEPFVDFLAESVVAAIESQQATQG